jgi:hypothetical protein
MSTPHPETGDETDAAPDRESTGGTPRWVKVFGIVALVVVLLFVILMLVKGPGGHGPGRHAPTSGVSQPTIQQS